MAREMWVSYYLNDGTLGGATIMAIDYEDAEEYLTKTIRNFGGIADYGFYDELN